MRMFNALMTLVAGVVLALAAHPQDTRPDQTIGGRTIAQWEADLGGPTARPRDETAGRATRKLAKLLESESVANRREILRLFEHARPVSADALPAIAKALSHEDASLRAGAAHAIFAMVGALRPWLQPDVERAGDKLPEAVEALSVARSFIYECSKLCLNPLAQSLSASDEDVVLAAARALGAFGPFGTAAVPQLLASCGMPSSDVRRVVCQSLLAIGGAEVPHAEGILNLTAIAPLTAVLGDNDPSARLAAAEALGALTRDAAPQAVSTFEKALGDEDPRVRTAACVALTKTRPGPLRLDGAIARALDRAREEEEYSIVRAAMTEVTPDLEVPGMSAAIIAELASENIDVSRRTFLTAMECRRRSEPA